MWIITTGLWDTVGNVVGKTIKDFNLTSVESHRPEEGVQLLGIAPWGLVQNGGYWKSDGAAMEPTGGEDDVAAHQASTKPRLLNPNFNYFLLVDDGTVGSGRGGDDSTGHLANFHARFEESLVKTTNIPVVTLLINGGCGSLKAVERNVTDGIPIVVVKGSGGAADLVADFLKDGEVQKSRPGSARSNIPDVRRSVDCEEFRRISGHIVKDEVAISLERIRERESLISFVDLVCDPMQDSLQRVLSAALGTLGARCDKVLEVALKLDSLHVVTDKTAFACLNSEIYLKKLGFEALMKHKISFFTSIMNPWKIRHLVDTKKFICLFMNMSKGKEQSYHCRKELDLGHSSRVLLEAGSEKRRPPQDATDDEKVEFIQSMMKIWIGDFYEHQTKEPLSRVYDQRSNSFHSVEDLFVWSVLTCSKPFMLHFLKMLSFPISGALIAFTILKRYVAADPSSRMAPVFEKEAAFFEAMACDLLTACFESCGVRTLFMLLQEVPAFGRTSLLQLALHSKSLEFMSHPASQQLLDQVWYQGVSPANGLLYVFLPRKLAVRFMTFQFCSVHRDFEQLVIASQEGNSNQFLRKKIRNLTKVGIDVGMDDSPLDKQKLRKYKNSTYRQFQEFLCGYGFQLTIWLIKFNYSDMLIKDQFPNCTSVTKDNDSTKLMELMSCTHDSIRQIALSMFLWFIFAMYYLFFFGFIANELYQLYMDGPLKHWQKSLWNVIDFIIIVSFLVGLFAAFSFGGEVAESAYECSFIICFLLLSSRFLLMFGAYPTLGTRVSIMKAMINDLWIFFAILAVFAIPYGITCFALIENKEGGLEGEDGFYKHLMILSRPYRNMMNKEVFGNLNDKIHTRFRREILFPTLQAFYVIVSNLLLMKILIAMLNFTFKEVRKKELSPPPKKIDKRILYQMRISLQE